MTKAEVEPGSPEDRILTAVIEGMEASGEVITPKVRNCIICSFMMGYTAGSSIAATRAKVAFKFCGEEAVEETIKEIIQDVNKVIFTEIRKE